MNRLNKCHYNLTKTSFVVATLLCALCLGTGYAQTPTNGLSEFKKRVQEQLANRQRSPQTETTTTVAEPQPASVTEPEPQGENLQERAEQQQKALGGSWISDVTVAVPADFATVFKALFAFTEDGRVFATAQGDIVPPVQSPGFGAWEHLGGRTYAFTFMTISYNSEGELVGSLIGTGKISGTVTLDRSGNKFSGRFKFVLSDPDGKELLTTAGPLQASRIKVEPLDYH